MCNVIPANFIGGWMDDFHPVPKHDKHTEIILHWNSIPEFDKQKENKKIPGALGIMFSSWKAFFR
jgi:hypothetical protein